MDDTTPPPLVSPGDKRVLIVDDDPLIRDLLELAVSAEGFQVVMAKEGVEATTRLAERPFDLIITDLMMPGENGYDFMRKLAGAGAGRVPIVVVTASHLDPSTVAMIKQDAKVVEFLTKPIKMSLLILALHRELKTIPPENRSRGLNDR